MESVKTKNKLERTRELINSLAVARKEITGNIAAFKGVSLAAVQMMRAGGELFDDDFVAHLEEKEGMLEKAFNEVGLVDLVPEGELDVIEPESEADAVIEEAVAAPKGLDGAIITSLVEDIEELLDHTTAEGQKKILAILQSSQPQRTAEYEAEEARDEARDNQFGSMCELPMDVQTKLYRMFAATIRSSRKELEALVTEAA